MKESKKFFENNRLNKGFKKINDVYKSDESLLKEKNLHILPPLDIMEEYEEKFPGAFANLFKMAEKEQENKHNIASLANATTLKRIKMLYSFFVSLFIVLIAALSIGVYAITDGNLIASAVLFAISISAFMLLNYNFSGLSTARQTDHPKKKFSNRYPKRKHNNYKSKNYKR